MNTETQKRIDRLLKSARNAREAKNVAQREAAKTFLITRADELRGDRDALEVRLTKMWRWLDRNDPQTLYSEGEHSEQFIERETKAIAALHSYESVCNALNDAADVWLGKEA